MAELKITPEQRAKLLQLSDDATPGPWVESEQRAIPSPGGWGGDGEGAGIETGYATMKTSTQEFPSEIVVGGAQDEQGGAVGIIKQADATFIVAARNMVPDLLADLAAMEAALKYACREIDARDERNYGDAGGRDERASDWADHFLKHAKEEMKQSNG